MDLANHLQCNVYVNVGYDSINTVIDWRPVWPEAFASHPQSDGFGSTVASSRSLMGKWFR